MKLESLKLSIPHGGRVRFIAVGYCTIEESESLTEVLKRSKEASQSVVDQESHLSAEIAKRDKQLEYLVRQKAAMVREHERAVRAVYAEAALERGKVEGERDAALRRCQAVAQERQDAIASREETAEAARVVAQECTRLRDELAKYATPAADVATTRTQLLEVD